MQVNETHIETILYFIQDDQELQINETLNPKKIKTKVRNLYIGIFPKQIRFLFGILTCKTVICLIKDSKIIRKMENRRRKYDRSNF